MARFSGVDKPVGLWKYQRHLPWRLPKLCFLNRLWISLNANFPTFLPRNIAACVNYPRIYRHMFKLERGNRRFSNGTVGNRGSVCSARGALRNRVFDGCNIFWNWWLTGIGRFLQFVRCSCCDLPLMRLGRCNGDGWSVGFRSEIGAYRIEGSRQVK